MNLLAEWRSHKRRKRLPVARRNGALDAILRTQTVFVHIPKCGGKSVIRMLYGLDMHDWFGHANIEFYQTLLGPRRFDSFLKFTVLRAPVDRARSAFFFAKGGGFDLPEDKALKAAIANTTFEDFVLGGQLQDLMQSYVIFRPQYGFICNAKGEIAVDAFCRLEFLKTDLERVLGSRVATYSFAQDNRSEYDRSGAVSPVVQGQLLKLYARDAELYKTLETLS